MIFFNVILFEKFYHPVEIIIKDKIHLHTLFKTSKNINTWWVILLIIITFSVYFPGLDNEFVNWDDNVYVTNNPLIHSLSSENIKKIFSGSFEGHYHPITLLSFSVDYHFFGNKAWFYHLINILLHLLNTILVFILIRQLFNKAEIAVITALLFGIHPMHVESVVWITARKDVLFAMFFLLSLSSYLLYLKNSKIQFYLLSLLLFLLSVLSKSQAVSLSICLFAIDYLFGRKLLNKKAIIEKIPFLTVSIFFGIVTIIAQKNTGYSGESSFIIPLYQRIAYACYGFCMYIYKLIIPINLSAYYPYPLNADSTFPFYIYFLIIPAAFISGILFYHLKRNKSISFGILFFIINIILMLKLFPVANFIIADRYVYIPSTGFFIIIGILFSNINNPGSKWRRVAVSIMIIYSFFLGSLTFSRTDIWQNSFTLLDDILTKHPKIVTALNSRGDARAESGNLQAALSDFNRAIECNPLNSRSYRNRALVKYRLKNYKGSITDYNTSLEINPDDAITYFNRGLSKEGLNDIQGALADYDKAIQLNPSFAKAYANRARIYNISGLFAKAVSDLSTAIKSGIEHAELYFEKGYALYNLRKFDQAIEAFNKSIQLQANFTGSYLYRGYAKNNSGDYPGAVSDLDIAIQSDNKNALAYAVRGLAKIKSGHKEPGCSDLHTAEKLGLKQAGSEIKKFCKD